MIIKISPYLFLISVFLIVGISAIPSSSASDDFKDCCIQTRDLSPEEILNVIYFIQEQGGQVYHAFPPNILQAKINDTIKNALTAHAIARNITESVVQNGYDMQNAPSQYMGVVSWNDQFAPRSRSAFRQAGTIYNDVFLAPEELEVRRRGIEYRERQNAYMAGICAVSVIFVECDGSREPQMNRWTKEKKDLAFAQIRNGLDWWAKAGKEKAHLTWVYEIRDAAIGYEPINHPMKNDSLWIKDAMRSVYGRNPHYTHYFQCRLYAGELRERLKTDWSFIIFVCENSNDPDGEFTDGGFAYAYLGGPYMVLTYKNDGWEPNQLSRTAAHEAGHIFRALDEYAEAVDGPRMSGVLKVENGNHELYGTMSEECLMKHHTYGLCNFTLGQIGWWDKNNDGRFDPDETWKHPASTIKVTDSVPPPPSVIAAGSIAVETNPADASVYLNDILRGQSPVTIPDLELKNHDLKIIKMGYLDQVEQVRLSSTSSSLKRNISLKIADPVEALAENLINDNPELLINMKIEKPAYAIGEELIIEFNTNRDCYFYLINIASDKEVNFLFPNEYSSDNFIRGNTKYSFPDRFSKFEFVVTGPAGKDRMVCIASKNKIEGVHASSSDSGQELIQRISSSLQVLSRNDWASRLIYFSIVNGDGK